MESSSHPKRSPLAVIFVTVFIDLVGFGIILPLSPFLASRYNATPTQIGLLMSVYSLFQFLCSPYWGSLSDRVGRRPVILISLFGGAISYAGFAFADSLSALFIWRAFAGLFGGNISTAHAYIADVTDESNRSKGMGLLGAAFGLGFIFGPLIGGVLTTVGLKLGSQPPFGENFPALGAALICFANFVVATFVLRESHPPEARRTPKARGNRLVRAFESLSRPLVGPLIGVFFISGLAMAQMEVMLFPFMKEQFGWDQATSSYGFAYVGVLMVLTQGVLIRRLMPRFGEPRVLTVGLLLFAVSLFGIAFANSIAAMAVVMTILAIGNGLMRPPNLGMISLLSSKEEQGAVLGVTNSLASLGRIAGPAFGGWLYERMGRDAPFISAGILALIALGIVGASYARLPVSGKKAQAT